MRALARLRLRIFNLLTVSRWHIVPILRSLRSLAMRLIFALSALSLLASPVAAATHCRDKHGKFIKCAKVVKKSVRCNDAKGHFINCK